MCSKNLKCFEELNHFTIDFTMYRKKKLIKLTREQAQAFLTRK